MQNRYTYAQYLALFATVLNILGILLYDPTEGATFWGVLGILLILLGLVLTLCAYCLGGLWTAVKAALSIAKWGWLVVPFPYDLATGPVTFILALIVLFLFPIFPVRKAAKANGQ